MLAALAFAVLLAGGAILPPPASPAVQVVPDEPGTVVLPAAPTYQAVVADLDDDGTREVIRLVSGRRASATVEVWRQDGERWVPAGSLEAIPSRPVPGQGDVVFARAPVRLIVRRVSGGERVTLVRQPRFVEPGVDEDCCLLLHDLALVGGSLRLVVVADPAAGAQSVRALDMDGDGTDELVAIRASEAAGATEAAVYRWAGTAFATPVITQLEVELETTPFVVDDSDGQPGAELGAIAAIPGSDLVRLRLVEDGRLALDQSGLEATSALGVPLGDGRGLAIMAPSVGIVLREWPAGETAGAPLATMPMPVGALIGVTAVSGVPRLLVEEPSSGELRLFDLPTLADSGLELGPHPAAAAFDGTPLAAFVGPIPGAVTEGAPTFVHDGRLLTGDPRGEPRLVAIFAGARPIGLAGRDAAWLAIEHATLPQTRLHPSGGRLAAPVFQPGGGVTIAPLGLVLGSTPPDGSLEIEPEGPRLADGELALAGGGMAPVTVRAPAGSRVYLADDAFVAAVYLVPESGRLRLQVGPDPEASGVDHAFGRTLSVVTPAGHGYVASWRLRVLATPPPLEATTSTPLGSPQVEVRGRTAPYATVIVAGRRAQVDAEGRFEASVPLPPWPTRVELRASDPAGNVSTTTLSGVGILDYRGLPWIPISVAVVGVAAIVLFLRVPRARRAPRTPDDAVLEEMEPD